MAENPNLKKVSSKKFKAYKSEQEANSLGYGRVMPQAIPLEEAVLGAIMMDKDGLTSVIDILRKESFYKEEHQNIYEVMLELFEKSQPIDILTVHEALKKAGNLDETGGVNYLMDLTHRISSAANIEYHARIVAQKYIQRELIRVSTETIRDSFEDTTDVFELLDAAERSLYEITEQNLSTGFESLKALAVKARNEIEAVSSKSDGLTGVPTGFEELDKMTSGWQKSDLIIVAARPGMGKTAYTLSLAYNAAKFGKGVAIFSLEMANLQLVNRLIAMDAEVDSRSLRNGDLGTEEWERLHAAVERLSEFPIYIDDTPGINIFELRAKCRRLKQNHNIEMIIIDYLQLMTGAPGAGGNREQEISTISRALKGLAKELSVPVMALSQLSRAVETRGGNKRPQLSDLRESGAIEQDADMVTFIYRPAYYDLEPEDPSVPRDAAEIIISKHRNGSLGSVFLKFIPQFIKFAEPEDMGFGDLPDMGDPFSSGIVTRPSKMNEDGGGTSDLPDIPF